jgi:hypothetical protein
MRGQETYHKNVVEIGGAWSLRPLLTCEARDTAHKKPGLAGNVGTFERGGSPEPGVSLGAAGVRHRPAAIVLVIADGAARVRRSSIAR